MNPLYWREPAWLLLVLLPALWLVTQHWRSRRAALRYADPALQPWALQTRAAQAGLWRRLCLLLAWLLIALAAAGPRSPAWLPPEQDHSNGTLLVVLDLSRSMDAADLWPNRRQHALRLLTEAAPQLTGARSGLIVYGGRSHVLLPPTADRAILAQVARQLGELRLPTHGSDLAGALALARESLTGVPGERRVLVLSDMDLADGERQAASREAARLSAEGIGVLLGAVATEGGAALPGPDGSWLQQDGATVLSRLDMAALDRLIPHAGILRLDSDDAAGRLLSALPDGFRHPRLDAQAAVIWHEHYPWLLLPAALLWLAASLRLSAAAPAGLAAGLLYLFGLSTSLPLKADDYRDAYLALQGGDASVALARFDRQQGYAARMGSGTSCYRLQDWPCARQHFAAAVIAADGDGQRAGALYNLGHAIFQVGDFRTAAGLFSDALRYRPDYPAAAHNRDYAIAMADEVERLAERTGGGRAGRGPRAGAPRSGPLPADARLQLDDRGGAALPATDPTAGARQALLNRGLQYVQLTEAQAQQAAGEWARVYRQVDQRNDGDARLWQRLLEQAEGFPATPEHPYNIPGVRPW